MVMWDNTLYTFDNLYDPSKHPYYANRIWQIVAVWASAYPLVIVQSEILQEPSREKPHAHNPHRRP
jgi:hypothetical protein